jgi:LytS/YehU family sensor histidine kinase
VRLQWDVDDAPAIDVLALSLQPLLENAFVHAVEPCATPTTLHVGVRREGNRVRLSVADDGSGPRPAPGRGSGVGLTNLRERLQAVYGDGASLELRSRPGGGSEAVLEIPADA